MKAEKRLRVVCKRKENTANTAEKYQEESDGYNLESESSEQHVWSCPFVSPDKFSQSVKHKSIKVSKRRKTLEKSMQERRKQFTQKQRVLINVEEERPQVQAREPRIIWVNIKERNSKDQQPHGKCLEPEQRGSRELRNWPKNCFNDEQVVGQNQQVANTTEQVKGAFPKVRQSLMKWYIVE